MAIKSNVAIPVQDIGATDTLLLQATGSVTRYGVQSCVFHNTSASNRTVTVYESPDGTSASGDQVAVYTLAPNESADIIEIVGQSYTAAGPENIVAQASGTGVNARITVTQYDGNS